MGIFRKLKGAISSKAEAALDRAIDPAKELDLTIAELEAGRKAAIEELLSYKAGAKAMATDLEARAARVEVLEQRAMQAVRAGDDELARRCLREKAEAEAELTKATRDRDELASHALKLNASRKQLETRLQVLKLKKGTLATQLAAARGKGDPLRDQALFDKLDAAAAAIDDDAARAEAEAELGGDALAAATPGLAGTTETAAAAGEGDAALAALKAKIAADPKRLKK
jgi:phage shock protein A